MFKAFSFRLLYFKLGLHDLTRVYHTGSYTLSVRDLDQDEGDVVKHYRIRNMDDGGFYITAKISFSTIRELVKHHKRTGPEGGRTQGCTR